MNKPILFYTLLGIILIIVIVKIQGKYSYKNLEKVLLDKNSKYKDCFWYLKYILLQLKSGKIKNDKDLDKRLISHYKGRGGRTKKNPQFFKNKQTLYKELEEIFAIYLNNLEKNTRKMIINEKRIGIGISFEDAEQYHALTQKIYGILGALFLENTSEKTKNTDTKKTKIGNKDSKKEKWMEDARKGDISDMMKELAEEAYEKGEITNLSKKEKKEINKKDYSKLTKSQIKDRQVYGAIRAFAELMKVDGEMHPNEFLILDKFTNEEQKKLSKEYSQESDEFKFVWAKDENVFEALKTYNKKELKSFFDKLFTMAVIDGEVKQPEINFFNIIYSNITGTDEKNTSKEVIKMFKDWDKRNGS